MWHVRNFLLKKVHVFPTREEWKKECTALLSRAPSAPLIRHTHAHARAHTHTHTGTHARARARAAGQECGECSPEKDSLPCLPAPAPEGYRHQPLSHPSAGIRGAYLSPSFPRPAHILRNRMLAPTQGSRPPPQHSPLPTIY